MSKKIYKTHISARVLCTSITNRVPSWFDRFTAFLLFYEQKLSQKLISPRVLCTSFTNRVPSWFNHFIGLLEIYHQKCHKDSYLSEFCAQVSKIEFLAELTVLSACYEMYEQEMSQNSHLREFCAQVSQIVFLVDLNVLRLITNCMSRNITKLKSSHSSVLKYQRSCFKLIWPFYRLLKLKDQKC